MSDLTTPEGRLATVEALGPDGYNRAMEKHIADTTLETVRGNPIRIIEGTRWGTLYQVGTQIAFNTLDKARAYANANPKD